MAGIVLIVDIAWMALIADVAVIVGLVNYKALAWCRGFVVRLCLVVFGVSL